MRDDLFPSEEPGVLVPESQRNDDEDIVHHGENQPLLHTPDEDTWKPPRGFTWIQLAIMSNVFLYGLDSTITAATYAVISSEFDAANTASWLTTSYLITSTAFQPLYGRVSDIFGRRLCFFISTVTFALGCLGCGLASNVVLLNVMRALTGFVGGGLMTMATIVNSDMIPFRMAAYGYLFMLPLFFQVVLLDSATTAGARLAILFLATPVGGVIAGIVMSRWGKLLTLVRIGAFLMVLGNGLVASLRFQDSKWKYFVYVFPANLGQGIIYPGILFTSLASFSHSDHAVTASTVYLVRSMGTVWGVSTTSAIVQTTLSARLPEALSGVPDKLRIIEQIRHSVDYIHELPLDLQLKVRLVYYDGIRYAFGVSTAVAVAGFCAACIASGTGLRTTHK
ncbi:mfs drug transporter [Fusarium langsethiae]|uniref:Mfs drug transporter n=1 Tax=Fusarium langsethiae TaxID=179993 RepID=A0A0N0V880_FUSLA|nr:mfs drug transporter [Fusarium langsethiae]